MTDLDRLAEMVDAGFGEFEGDQVLAFLPELIAVARSVARPTEEYICKVCGSYHIPCQPRCPNSALVAKLAEVFGDCDRT